MFLALTLLSLIMSFLIPICIGRIPTMNRTLACITCFGFFASIALSLIFFVNFLFEWYDIAGEKTINKKFEIYQEENKKNESEIDVLVKRMEETK